MIGGVFRVRAAAAHSHPRNNISRTYLGFLGACSVVQPAAQQPSPSSVKQTQQLEVQADLQYLDFSKPDENHLKPRSVAGSAQNGQRPSRKQVCWSKQHAKVLKSIREQQAQLPQHSKVLVAVSGGQVRSFVAGAV